MANSFTEEDLKKFSKWLFAQPCHYKMSVDSLKELPDYSLPEVAFVGRSNVGKSSLVNALMGGQKIAFTSKMPGRTQLLNFFQLAQHLILVDLPGFGYAQAPREKVKHWTQLMRLYVQGRPTLKRIYLLIDSRHGIKKNDEEIIEMLDKAGVSYQIVLTKLDKISEKDFQEVQEKVTRLCDQHPAAYPSVLGTSSLQSKGIESLREHMASLVLERDIE